MTETQGSGRKPRDEIIRREVLRRIDTGEPITYRAIIGSVGGSPPTVKRVLTKLGLGTDARGDADREIQVRQRLRDAGVKLAEADAYVKGAKETGEAMAREITCMLGTVKDAYGMLIREVETFRVLQAEVKRELAANRPASDPLMEARLRKAQADNGKMAETIERLKRVIHEAGIEQF